MSFKLGFGVSKDKRTKKSVKYKDGVLPGQKSPDHSARDSPQEAPQGQYTVLYVQEVVPFILMNILCKLNMTYFLDILYYSYKNTIRPVYSGIIILA